MKKRLSKRKSQENIEPDIQTDEDDFNLDFDELYRPQELAVPVAMTNKSAKSRRVSKKQNKENVQPDIHRDEDYVAMAEVSRPTQPTTRSGRKVIAKVRTSM